MPAYPFAPAPKYAALKERLQKEFGCKLLKVEEKIKDLQGVEHDVYYFERKHKGKTYRAVAPDLPDDTFVLYSVVRSLCARLRIDPANFGLTLG
jgi:hypothetical protein